MPLKAAARAHSRNRLKGALALVSVASLSCCKFAAAQVPGGLVKFTLGGVHLLGDGGLVALVARPLELLALELGELDPLVAWVM